ncbi:expressed protein [Echinococcus multilocularis]|uniref:Expressed protein n=1 Tax=Echinococcus multilocularis TaxID=6211 RepID=A0A087VWU6_ECHMU|nr:expressed protein [Echinococcus multilocularis]
MSSPSHYIPVFLLLNIFFLISGGCAVSPLHDWEEEGDALSEDSLSMMKRANTEYATTEVDRPRILCGQSLIHTLKEQCGQRGTFSPYHKRAVRELIRVARGLPDISDFVDSQIHLHKRYDDICEVYLRYEPDSPLSQCCCLGLKQASGDIPNLQFFRSLPTSPHFCQIFYPRRRKIWVLHTTCKFSPSTHPLTQSVARHSFTLMSCPSQSPSDFVRVPHLHTFSCEKAPVYKEVSGYCIVPPLRIFHLGY